MKPVKCIICGGPHYQTFCFYKKRNPPKQLGKVGEQWIITRKRWAQANCGEDYYLYATWNCHYCGVVLVFDRDSELIKNQQAQYLTLDHVLPRGSNPQLRNDLDNLVPACRTCNVLKGSQSYIRFCERSFPHLLSEDNPVYVRLLGKV